MSREVVFGGRLKESKSGEEPAAGTLAGMGIN
jgi:hypothetical protein